MHCFLMYHLCVRFHRGNMSSESTTKRSNEKPTKTKEFRQKQMMLNARIKYRENALKGFK